MTGAPGSAAPETGFIGAAAAAADMSRPCFVSAASALPAAAARPRGCSSRSLGGHHPCGPAQPHDRCGRSQAGQVLA